MLFSGIDSIITAVYIFAKKPFRCSKKHAILTLFQGIELILKAKLYEVNELLIYSNIDKELKDDSSTVGIKEIKIRLRNLGLDLEKDEEEKLNKIQSRRNKIQHHFYDEDLNDLVIIGEGLEFANDFLSLHFKKSLEELVSEEDYRVIHEVMDEFGRTVRLAEEKASAAIAPKSKDDLLSNDVLIYCPECWKKTLILFSGTSGTCFFCNAKFTDVELCHRCNSQILHDPPPFYCYDCLNQID